MTGNIHGRRKIGHGALGRQTLYWHFPHYRHNPGPYSIIRAGDWRLIKWCEDQPFLFNLKDDLGEKKDLAAAMPDRVAELGGKLMAHLSSSTDRVPVPNPNYKPKSRKR